MFMTDALERGAHHDQGDDRGDQHVANSTRRVSRTAKAISASVTAVVKRMLGKRAFVDPKISGQDGDDQCRDSPDLVRTKLDTSQEMRCNRAQRAVRAFLSEGPAFDPSWTDLGTRHKSFTEQHAQDERAMKKRRRGRSGPRKRMCREGTIAVRSRTNS